MPSTAVPVARPRHCTAAHASSSAGMPVRLTSGVLKAAAVLVGLAGLAVPVVADPVLVERRPTSTPPSATDTAYPGPAGPALSAAPMLAPAVAPTFGVRGFTAVAKPAPAPPRPARATVPDPGRSSRATVASRSMPRIAGTGTAGLTADARVVLASVTWAFPRISSVIGVRPDSLPDHPSGHAIDFMVPSPFSGAGITLGNEVVAAVQANAAAWHVQYLIYRQRIWTPGSGWRAMSDRGSPTADHLDHVHVTVS